MGFLQYQHQVDQGVEKAGGVRTAPAARRKDFRISLPAPAQARRVVAAASAVKADGRLRSLQTRALSDLSLRPDARCLASPLKTLPDALRSLSLPHGASEYRAVTQGLSTPGHP